MFITSRTISSSPGVFTLKENMVGFEVFVLCSSTCTFLSDLIKARNESNLVCYLLRIKWRGSFQETSRYDYSRVITISCHPPSCLLMREIPVFGLEPLNSGECSVRRPGWLDSLRSIFSSIISRRQGPASIFRANNRILFDCNRKNESAYIAKKFISQMDFTFHWMLRS